MNEYDDLDTYNGDPVHDSWVDFDYNENTSELSEQNFVLQQVGFQTVRSRDIRVALNETTGAALSLRSSACRFACKESLCSGQVPDVFDRVLEYHADNSPETHAKFVELAK